LIENSVKFQLRETFCDAVRNHFKLEISQRASACVSLD
jgi:hypothetical protein